MITDIKKYVIGFVEGTVNHKEFVKECITNPDILNWIQSIVPEGETCTKLNLYKDETGVIRSNSEIIPYDIHVVFEQAYYQCTGQLSMYRTIHDFISDIVQKGLINEKINVSTRLQKIRRFMIEYCPSYVGGPDVDESMILETLYDEIPVNLSESKRGKLFKERVKELFPCADKKYPRWIQEPEWPMSNGKPMRFVSQNRKGEIYYYIFEDIITKEQRVVEQFT